MNAVTHPGIGIRSLVIVETIELGPHLQERSQTSRLPYPVVVDPVKPVVLKQLAGLDGLGVPPHRPEHPHPVESVHTQVRSRTEAATSSPM